MFRKRDTHIHFVGIGGIGMSGIAEVLLNMGYRVTGTDLASSETTQRLTGFGAVVHRGHAADHLGDADVVVISSAVPADNPEVIEARRRHIPVIPRAEMLAELMRLKQGLLIAGSHGKTTTTSLVASVLHEAGLDPTVVIGGKLNSFDSNARLGAGDLLVAEADESDGSFLVLTPTLAVITNIDAEHLDHYGSLDALLDAFVGFANRVPFYGQAIVCIDNPNVRAILPRLTKRTVTYGIDPANNGDADYRATEIRSEGTHTHFRVIARGEDQGVFSLAMPGRHNVLNALATIALCDEQQVHIEITRKALAEFAGVQRRFTLRGEVGGVTVVDDYGHHPTEIRATLAGARTSYPDHRLVAVLQPHRYTRVRDNLDEFPGALDDADVVIVTDVYPAGEAPIEGISGKRLAELIRDRREGRTVLHQPELETLTEALAELARAGDLFVTLGAGSITRTSVALVEHLSEHQGARAK
jgi:UDP-N-acetylmuramate--alanine ligase